MKKENFSEQDEFLNQLLAKAETATSEPPPPPGGIPKQWVPGWIRWPLRIYILPLILLDLFAQRVAKFFIRPPFQQAGSCKRRGNCCHYILIPEAKGILGKVFYFWQTQMNGFYLREKSPRTYEGKKMLVMGCRYLKSNGSCGHYYTRPTVCRKWPRIEIFGFPKVLRGCGFKAVARKGYEKEPYLTILREHDEDRT